MYIQKIKKTAITFFSLLLLSAMATGTASAAENKKTIDYVALGDSLAAGQKPTELGSVSNKLYGTSYPKFIRDELSGKGMLSSYANFGKSGYQTGHVIYDLNYDNVTIEAIKSAEIITLDIGANDIFTLLKAEEGDVSQLLDELADKNEVQIAELIGNINYLELYMVPDVAIQVGEIVDRIKGEDGLNPDAKIYVMGYYNNAFSFLADYSSDDPALQGKINRILPELTGLIDAYNGALQTATAVSGATYVDTTIAMAGKDYSNARTYLPLDIHPTVQGYRAIAQAFLDAMK